ncbi:hypothetical protein MWU75_14040 [Ornithinimicrobium sp. F0845]|uniref:hypothetical protein n=1 Tax=Ornithinimicrobium sp. F0845 TaxID=2926412 RepID=UPI001FF670F4|nr:hypothetical protein [Ornithinimicrobium sp. F0845]MCK0113265.1 hypothetical protein [Ornithinimicrobium sp. F0845]
MSAVVSGVSWSAAAVSHNLQPQGCVAEGCASSVMRGSTALTGMLLAVAGLMLVVSVSGLLLMTRRASQRGPLVWTAVTSLGVGVACFLAAGVVSGFVDADWSGMPLLVAPGIVFLVLGLLMVATIVWRARVLPHQVSVAILVTALLLPLANEQTSLVLLAVPFGLAWAGTGVYLLARDRHGVRPRVLAPNST